MTNIVFFCYNNENILNLELIMLDLFSSETVKSVSALIQASITPVFMLAGISGFLNVFTGRLARIVDRIEKIASFKEDAKSEIPPRKRKIINAREDALKKRMRNINKAILFMCATGLLVSVVMVTMFLSVLLGFKSSLLVSMLFIVAMLSFIVALLLFSVEIVYAVSSAEVDIGLIPTYKLD